ncbi:MAG: SDR family oxidoreductase [Chloroflexota bacterium]
MKDKICLVTGATSGIGEASAQALAAMSATVIVGARNEEKAKATVAKIRAQSGNDNVEYLIADLSVQAQVRDLAKQVEARYPRLDVLLNNAGGMYMLRHESADGIELVWATNHLNYFLLTHLLLPMVKKSAAGRIVNVASRAHFSGSINFDDLQHKNGYSPMKVYGQSKLANVLFTRELAKRLDGSKVTVNAVHPGLVATSFAQNSKFAKLIGKLVLRGARSSEKGAETLVYLASSPEVERISGEYFYDKKVAHSSSESKDMEIAARLWQVSAEMVWI